jgi:hypothetical protein
MSLENYETLKAYALDLAQRAKALEEWKKRHPDWDTPEFRDDERTWTIYGEKSWGTTFHPNDPRPRTSDVLTAERFGGMLVMLVELYERMNP